MYVNNSNVPQLWHLINTLLLDNGLKSVATKCFELMALEMCIKEAWPLPIL